MDGLLGVIAKLPAVVRGRFEAQGAQAILDIPDRGAVVTKSIEPHSPQWLHSPERLRPECSGWLDVFGQISHQSVLGGRADDSLLLHSVLEQDQGGDAHHVVLGCGHRAVVDVQFADVYRVLFSGNLLENRGR